MYLGWGGDGALSSKFRVLSVFFVSSGLIHGFYCIANFLVDTLGASHKNRIDDPVVQLCLIYIEYRLEDSKTLNICDDRGILFVISLM